MIITELIAYLFTDTGLAFWKTKNKNIKKWDKKDKAKKDKDNLKADMEAVEAEIKKGK